MSAGQRIETSLLEGLVPFGSLSDTHLSELSRKGIEEEHPKGSILFKRGEESRQCHYLLAGSVDLADADFTLKAALVTVVGPPASVAPTSS